MLLRMHGSGDRLKKICTTVSVQFGITSISSVALNRDSDVTAASASLELCVLCVVPQLPLVWRPLLQVLVDAETAEHHQREDDEQHVHAVGPHHRSESALQTAATHVQTDV